jgi:AraC-like DNA-binding protein
LFRHFRRATGLSPQQYVQRLRMRQARMLLAEGDLSVKQVAYACGFSDARYFSRRFRAAHGVPPSRYARSNTAPAD